MELVGVSQIFPKGVFGIMSYKLLTILMFWKTEKMVPPPPEDAEKFGIHLNGEYHGTDGPLPVSYPIWYPDLHAPFLDSLSKLGVPANHDPVSSLIKFLYLLAFTRLLRSLRVRMLVISQVPLP